MQCDVLCRVIDNFGDIGVCLRLARELAQRGHRVRLFVDDASALVWMAPGPCPGLHVLPWDAQCGVTPGDVVIEAFGCAAEAPYLGALARCTPAPVWINLEYLSAEGYALRSHGLASPQLAGPAQGLTKWFYFPGFAPSTGGLLREAALPEQRAGFERAPWLHAQGVVKLPNERLVSLFCYANPALPGLLERLQQQPTRLLLTPGPAFEQCARLLGPGLARGALRAQALPWLAQDDYDRLLWACDLNFVRGEDSFVRAQWARVPFVWQIYPQAGHAHAAKLHAFLDIYLARWPVDQAATLRALWSAWNTLGDRHTVWPAWPQDAAWQTCNAQWTQQLERQPDLCTQLLSFINQRS